MNGNDLTFAIVASTAGSVMYEVLKNEFLRSRVHSVVVDRACDAIDKARSRGVRTEIFLEEDVDRFCDCLGDYLLAHKIDYVFSYYTKFYSKKLRETYQDRIINFHPSILPAFKGMDGFGDAAAYHARFVGNTVEFIADVMDEGKIIMQTVCPLDVNVPLSVVRHRLFVQQCQALLQVAKWLSERRVVVVGRRVIITDVRFTSSEFSPALEFDAAMRLAPENGLGGGCVVRL